MIRTQFRLDLSEELIVDNFAGGGGASTGIEMALGRHVDHAINHDPHALGMHRINHPQTVHHCEDIYDVDPATITEGRKVGFAWFSPDCKHFSKAKGGKPLDKKIRGLCLVMLRWAAIRTRVMHMENVEEIRTWGPLDAQGKPDKKHMGRTWRAFLDALGKGVCPDHPDLPEMLSLLRGTITREQLIRGFGYHVEHRELRACEYGAPTIRKRLFMIARCDGRPVVWPERGDWNPRAKRLGRPLKEHRPIAECIDWRLPCPSIFLTREKARRVRCKRPLAKNTLRRVAAGIDRYVLRSKKPFIVSLTHEGGERIEPITEPARTVTGAHRGEKALCVPVMVNTANSKTTGRGPNVWGADEALRTVTTASGFAIAETQLAPFMFAWMLNVVFSTPRITWLLLTKRPELWRERMYSALRVVDCGPVLEGWLAQWLDGDAPANVWVGATVEDQARANERLPSLLRIPAQVRFLSCEPLLGPLQLNALYDPSTGTHYSALERGKIVPGRVDWVICGGESGRGSRPSHPNWFRSLRDQCAYAGVAFHFKQWGDWSPRSLLEIDGKPWGGSQDFVRIDPKCEKWPDVIRLGEHGKNTRICENCTPDMGEEIFVQRVGKKLAGRVIDGREWTEFPEVAA